MNEPLVPVLVLVVLPVLLWCVRTGRPRSRAGRIVGGIALTAATLAACPWQGIDYGIVKRLNLLIAVAAVVLLGLRASGRLDARRLLRPLAVLAAFSVLVWTDFLTFHGARTWVHLHDVAHYYLGAKYWEELDYSHLYTGILRAEAELYDDRFQAIEARDLATYERVHIRELLQESGSVKAAFTPERWYEFRQDVRWFRDRLSPDLWQRFLLDHGFNPTPVWVLIGSPLANLVPAGSDRGILLLALLDPLLLLLMLGGVARAFGREAALWSTILFTVSFGATFGWTGGAFLRYLWLAALVLGVCCLRRRRGAAAGALVALAALLRVFPAIFVLPLLVRSVVRWRQGRAVPHRHRRLLAAAVLTGFGLVGASLLMPAGLEQNGLDRWLAFGENLRTHLRNIAPNVVGLTDVLAHRPWAESLVTAEEFEALKDRRQAIRRAAGFVVFLPLLVVCLRRAVREPELEALLLALPLLWAGTTVAGYYHGFLILVILARRHRPADLALLFGVEAASYLLLLFEDREGTLYVYRSVALAWLYLALLVPSRRRRLRRGAVPERDGEPDVAPA